MALMYDQIGVQTLASTTNAQVLSSTSIDCESFIIYAPSTNTGLVCLVGNTTTGTLANGVPLNKGESQAIGAGINRSGAKFNLNTQYWVGDTVGDKLACSYVKYVKPNLT